jgi:hypothetical protein
MIELIVFLQRKDKLFTCKTAKRFEAMSSSEISFAQTTRLIYFVLRLEYKYHKLIQNASDRSGELPGAPQCVGDDDDDEEEVGYVRIFGVL